MASIILNGTLLDPSSKLAIGDEIRFTHRTTTGSTIQSAQSSLTIGVSGAYSIELQYGLILVEYKDYGSQQFKNLGVVTVNQDSTATTLPELLNAIVPPTDAQLLEFQAILANCVIEADRAESEANRAEVAATTSEAFAYQLTTTDLIASTATFTAETNIPTSGYDNSGDGGNGSWKQNGITGQTPSQSPAQLGDALLNDGNGNQWALVPLAATAESEVRLEALGGVGSGDLLSVFNAAFNCSSLVIVLGAGVFRTSGELLITTKFKKLRGAGKKATKILSTASSGNIVRFAPLSPSVSTEFLSDCGISGISITSSDTANTSTSLYLEQCSGFSLDDFGADTTLSGIVIAGGQLNKFQNFTISASGSTATTIIDKGLLEFIPTLKSNGVDYQNPFTCQLVNFNINGAFKADSNILIAAGDGLNFTNFYLGNALNNTINFDVNNVDSPLTVIKFNNAYLDGINNTTGTLRGIKVSSDSSKAANSVVFNNFFIGNYQETGALLGADSSGFKFSAGSFSNINGWAIDSQSANELSLSVSDVDIGTVGANDGTGAIKVNESRTVKLSDIRLTNIFGAGSAAFDISGDHEMVNISDSTVRNADTDLLLSMSSGDFTQSNNMSQADNQNMGGLSIQNKDITDPLLLDNYEEYNTIPTISFGGSSTGVTYSTQECRSTRIGRMVFFNLYVKLTSKGSGVGDVEIEGLPVTSLGLSSFSATVRGSSLQTDVLSEGLYALTSLNSQSVRVDKGTTGGSVIQLTDADLKDTAGFHVSGHYQVAN